MRAWQMPNIGQQMRLVDLADPTPQPGEVIIDVHAAGLCHSDVGILDGVINIVKKTPIVLGHEVAGVISRVGDGVSDWAVGDRVAVSPSYDGREEESHLLDVPPRDQATRRASLGTGRDGGYAEKITAWPHELVRVPANVSFAQAAVACDAGVTTYRAVKRAGRVDAGTRLGIIGFGGLGSTAVRVGRACGAVVHVAEIKEDLHDLARQAGAEEVVSSAADLARFDLDVIIDFAGFGTTTSEAIQAVRPKGTVVQVGLGVNEATLSTYELIMREVSLVGSLGGSLAELRETIELISAGHLEILVEEISFDDIGEGIHRLRESQIMGGRLVAVRDAR